MKSERRHELRENELADSVEQLSERLRPYVTPILSIAIGALVMVLVGLSFHRDGRQVALKAGIRVCLRW